LQTDGDPVLLGVVLENLLANAWKFTARASAPRIELGRTETQHGPALFVRDNGAGFDMTHAAKLFGAFQRLHSSSDYAGTGVGLAIVSRIVHRHGGRIWAEARPNEGATFYFTLEGGTS
jgi:light-regulated signal transduction histidine kinase (bacteriophytochrome)